METVTQNTDVNMSSESRIETNAFKPAQNYLAEASTSHMMFFFSFWSCQDQIYLNQETCFFFQQI
jgi:hypothetical protein